MFGMAKHTSDSYQGYIFHSGKKWTPFCKTPFKRFLKHCSCWLPPVKIRCFARRAVSNANDWALLVLEVIYRNNGRLLISEIKMFSFLGCQRMLWTPTANPWCSWTRHFCVTAVFIRKSKIFIMESSPPEAKMLSWRLSFSSLPSTRLRWNKDVSRMRTALIVFSWPQYFF